MDALVLSEDRAAEILTLSVKTLRRWRVEGRGPRYVRMGAAAAIPEPERAVLGALLLADDAEHARRLLGDAAGLEPTHFRSRAAGAAWSVIRELVAGGQQPDAVTVATELAPRARPRGGAHVLLSACMDGVPRVNSILAWAEAIRRGRPRSADPGELVRVGGVRREAVEWLWPHRLARGKVHVLDGDPGAPRSAR